MKVLAGVALALLLVVVPADPAHACSCVEPDLTGDVFVDESAADARQALRVGGGFGVLVVVGLVAALLVWRRRSAT